jgi:hypothetical protein
LEDRVDPLLDIKRVIRDAKTAAAAHAAMTTPTMAPVLKLDFARGGSTGKMHGKM